VKMEDPLLKLNQALSKIDNGTLTGTKRKAESEENAAQEYQKRVWLRYFDPNSMKHYYYNAISNRTQWEFPTKENTEVKEVKEVSSSNDSPVGIVDNTTTATVSTDPRDNDSKREGITEHSTRTEDTVIEGGSQQADNVSDVSTVDEKAASASSEKVDDNSGPVVYDGIYGQLLSGTTATVPGQASDVNAYQFGLGAVPQNNDSSYSVKASFNSTNGRFAAADGTYWDKMGLPNDREGRQLSRFMDLSTFSQNREDMKVKRVSRKPNRKMLCSLFPCP
jgi:hypothetical protein